MVLPARSTLRGARILSLVLFLAGYPWLAAGDIIELTNGDRITGRKTAEEDGTYVIESDLFGTIRLPVSAVATIKAAALADKAPAAGAEQPADEPPPPPESPPQLVGPVPSKDEASEADNLEAPSKPVATSTATPIFAPAPPAAETLERPSSFWEDNFFFDFLNFVNPLKQWDSKLSLGYRFQSGERDKNQIIIDFQSSRKLGKDGSLRTSFMYDFSTQTFSDGRTEKSTDRVKGNFRYRNQYTKRLFAQANTDYLQDQVKRINHDVNQSVGVGYKLIEGKKMNASLTPSLGAQYRADEVATNEAWSFVTSIFQDMEYQWTPKVKIMQDAKATVDPLNMDQFTVDFTAGFQNQVAEWLNMTLRYEFRYDNQVRAGTRKDQQNVHVLLGTSF